MTDTKPSTKVGSPASRWLIAALAVVIGVPVVATVVGAVTSPPTRPVPEGHLVHMEANAPSEHTTTLREMFSVGHDGRLHLLVSEQEPQDVDAGSREWISQPAVSPDGRQIAYLKQLITLQEEQQAIDWQLWVLPIDPATQQPGAPHMLADLTSDKRIRYFGLTWTPDSKSIVLLNNGKAKGYDVVSGQPYTFADNLPDDSRWPVIAPNRSLLVLNTDNGTWRVTEVDKVDTSALPADLQQALRSSPSKSGGSKDTNIIEIIKMRSQTPGATTYALSRDGNRIAYAPAGTKDRIAINTSDGKPIRTYKVSYGWSLLGGRYVTALRWSPSGRYIAYSVSKPPVGEDEIFYLDTRSGKCYKMPYRSGRASWDWGP